MLGRSGLVIYWMGASAANLAAFYSADVDLLASPVPLIGTLTSVSWLGSIIGLKGSIKGGRVLQENLWDLYGSEVFHTLLCIR